MQLGIVDRSAAGLRALRHAESVRSESGEVDGFKIFGDGLLAEQSRAEIGRAGFLRRGEAKKPGTTNIASLAARLLARPLALAFADERSCPPVPRFLSQQSLA